MKEALLDRVTTSGNGWWGNIYGGTFVGSSVGYWSLGCRNYGLFFDTRTEYEKPFYLQTCEF